MKKVFLFSLVGLSIIGSAFRSDSIIAESSASYATVYIYRGGQFVNLQLIVGKSN